jgi:hypothetical protein
MHPLSAWWCGDEHAFRRLPQRRTSADHHLPSEMVRDERLGLCIRAVESCGAERVVAERHTDQPFQDEAGDASLRVQIDERDVRRATLGRQGPAATGQSEVRGRAHAISRGIGATTAERSSE